MMNELKVFDFEGQDLAVKEIDGEVYFSAEQAAIGLGISQVKNGKAYVKWGRVNNYLNNVSAHVGKRKNYPQVEKGDFITEPQFYKLAIKANNPVAERFQDWVTSEVLPAIRKHGAYMTPKKIEEVLLNPDTIIKLAQELKSEREENKKLVEVNAEQANKIDKDADDVLFSHAIRYSNHAISIRELAAVLTQNGFVIGQNQLYKLLRLEHYISKNGILPMSDKMKRGYFRLKHGIKNGHAYSTTLVTPEGQKHIINKALKGKFDDSYQEVIASIHEN